MQLNLSLMQIPEFSESLITDKTGDATPSLGSCCPKHQFSPLWLARFWLLTKRIGCWHWGMSKVGPWKRTVPLLPLLTETW